MLLRAVLLDAQLVRLDDGQMNRRRQQREVKDVPNGEREGRAEQVVDVGLEGREDGRAARGEREVYRWVSVGVIQACRDRSVLQQGGRARGRGKRGGGAEVRPREGEALSRGKGEEGEWKVAHYS